MRLESKMSASLGFTQLLLTQLGLLCTVCLVSTLCELCITYIAREHISLKVRIYVLGAAGQRASVLLLESQWRVFCARRPTTVCWTEFRYRGHILLFSEQQRLWVIVSGIHLQVIALMGQWGKAELKMHLYISSLSEECFLKEVYGIVSTIIKI